MKRLLLIFLGWLILSLAAHAASFDCDKATNKLEKLICFNPAISKLDEELAIAYKAAMQDANQANITKQAQRQWLKERNNCTDAVCVKNAYETRLSSLLVRHAPLGSGAAPKHKVPSPTGQPRYGHCVDVDQIGSCEKERFSKTGKGYTVCEAYLKHLNVITEIPKCEAPVPPGFKQPEWEELDLLAHLQLAYQAEVIYFSEQRSSYKQPEFETWRQQLLSEMQVGKAAPQLRKTTVQPFGEKSITLLAYTRHRTGCKDAALHNDARWANNGFVHFLLVDDPQHPLRAIDSRVTRTQSELLLYAGRPYFVLRYFISAEAIEIIAFDPKMTNTAATVATMDAFYAKFGVSQPIDTTKKYDPDPNVYWAGQLCHFLPVRPSKR